MRIKDVFNKNRNIVVPLDLINILSYALSLSKEKLFVNFDRELNKKESLIIDRLIGERNKGKPLAYIIKHKEFFSEKFHVDQNVLVPRPETEILVEEALKLIKNNSRTLRIMDMGTGSGVIGIIIAKKTLCEMFCIDISFSATKVAKKNATQFNIENNIKFICSDLFTSLKKERIFDLILANLPYVSQSEWDIVSEDVKTYEPGTALYGGEDGLEIYSRFVSELPYYLKKEGHVLCEIGSNFQARKMKDMLECIGLKVAIKSDLSGRERVIKGS